MLIKTDSLQLGYKRDDSKDMSTKIILAFLAGTFGILFTGYGQVTTSVLADGEIYKFATDRNGVYKLDYVFIEQLGLNPTTFNPQQLSIYGQGGGPLPEPNLTERIDDLVEIPIRIVGEEDGRFDVDDYILFYGEDMDKVSYSTTRNRFSHLKNPYDARNYYFIKINDSNGRRMATSSPPTEVDYDSDSYTDYQVLEDESYNILHKADANLQGSGRRWLGDRFRGEREKSYDDRFDLTNMVSGEPTHVRMEFAARSDRTSSVSLTINDQVLSTNIARAQVTDIEKPYARVGIISEEIQFNAERPSITVKYPQLGNSNEGWLDFIAFNIRRRLVYDNDQFSFSDPKTYDFSSAKYTVANAVGSTIWDVSNPLQPAAVEAVTTGDGGISFSTAAGANTRYVIFRDEHGFSGEPVGKIPNQNLHAIIDAEYLVIYHPDFEAAAMRLAEHRRNFSRLRVELASIDQVFNEFSSGKVDPSAIRDFARMLYKRSTDFGYLVLVGDGSFDYRHIYTDFNDESFIPVFETEESFDPILSYPSDDYYALLDDLEGDNIRGALDIAVGRFPVRTLEEANVIVDKIVRYEKGEKTLGDWRTNILFAADDEDGNRHVNAADPIAENIRFQYPMFNINKVYFDAFEQENTPGGVFNFNAKRELNQSMFKGQLVVNYLGHGGSKGWAQERVLLKEDVDQWNNIDRLPLMITATCSFAGYDNPVEITAGEYTLTNPTGGSVALFTTVRAVYATQNERLTRSVFDHLFAQVDGELPPIGDLLINAKNSNAQDTSSHNARKFTLLGDPAMRLAVPQHFVRTSRINGVDINDVDLDTLKALSKVTVEGEVVNADGSLVTSFNGNLYPTIYDKAVNLKTLGQDKGSSERAFQLQKSIIFKGLASVTNGQFKFSFVVPKDINYAYGKGKISYYAEDGSAIDGAGAFSDIYVGGTDKNGINDDTGPLLDIFMNSEDFVFGGITDRNPTLLLKLSDDNGINVIGNSIGHDLTAVLDNDFQNTIILNEFYESEKDDYTRGTVRYPMSDLELGKHTLTVKAWDIANNSTEMLTEFVVIDEAEDGLRHVLNYPNPFSQSTCFQFEHSFLDQDLDIRVDILTPSGRRVTTLEKNIKASGNLSRDIKWDGRDDFGDRLANGIYIYRVTVRVTDASSGRVLKNTSDLQKLVVLR
ncbi:MAG: type IX secretion system sortase PorU [Saprospiraceae bacterium]|nr:type IX secretion system sortase PorU [Saprospiraceae bacterium]